MPSILSMYSISIGGQIEYLFIYPLSDFLSTSKYALVNSFNEDLIGLYLKNKIIPSITPKMWILESRYAWNITDGETYAD